MGEKRKDNKGRNLRTGEYQRTDGIYQFKYTDSTGKKRVIYSKNLAELRVKEEAVKQDLKDGIKTRAEVNLTVNDIDKILVVTGPGSFTGERIAVTIGKTIAYCLNIPIKVIDALTIIAINTDGDKKEVNQITTNIAGGVKKTHTVEATQNDRNKDKNKDRKTIRQLNRCY